MTKRAATIRRGLPAVPGLAVPADRRFRRSEARPGVPTAWRTRAIRTAAVAVVGLALVVAGRAAWHAFMTSRVFAVRQITVHGNARLSRGDLDSALDGLRRENLLSVDLDGYRRRLLGSAWVASATLRREFPSTVTVQIVERTPMAIVRLGDRLYLVDRDGVLIDEFGPSYRDLDLPLVDGLVAAPPSAAAVDPARLRVTRQCLDAIAATADLGRRVSQLDVSDARDVVVLLDTDPTRLELGDTRFVERLHTYLELAPTLKDRMTAADYVDLRFDERVYAHPLGASARSAGGKG